MLVYIKQTERIKFITKLFKILRMQEIEKKTIIYLPMNKKTKPKTQGKIANKLRKYLYNNSIKNVVLDKELMENEIIKNILYSYNINILDGTKLSKFLVYNIIEKIYKYKNKNIQAGEITLLVNENNSINIENIFTIAQNVKRLNIITNNTNKFRKVVDYLYNELGILIKLTNNMKLNLNSSDIIVNIDFTEEEVNKLDIPRNSIIVNIPKNINIKSKKFVGVNVKDWEIEVPKSYTLQDFEDTIMYETSILKKSEMKIFEQIQQDDITIKKLIGVNGVINSKEFV